MVARCEGVRYSNEALASNLSQCRNFLFFPCLLYVSLKISPPLGWDEALSEAREKLKAAEEAESKAFAAAVAEWRRGSGPVTCERIGWNWLLFSSTTVYCWGFQCNLYRSVHLCLVLFLFICLLVSVDVLHCLCRSLSPFIYLPKLVAMSVALCLSLPLSRSFVSQHDIAAHMSFLSLTSFISDHWWCPSSNAFVFLYRFILPAALVAPFNFSPRFWAFCLQIRGVWAPVTVRIMVLIDLSPPLSHIVLVSSLLLGCWWAVMGEFALICLSLLACLLSPALGVCLTRDNHVLCWPTLFGVSGGAFLRDSYIHMICRI